MAKDLNIVRACVPQQFLEIVAKQAQRWVSLRHGTNNKATTARNSSAAVIIAALLQRKSSTDALQQLRMYPHRYADAILNRQQTAQSVFFLYSNTVDNLRVFATIATQDSTINALRKIGKDTVPRSRISTGAILAALCSIPSFLEGCAEPLTFGEITAIGYDLSQEYRLSIYQDSPLNVRTTPCGTLVVGQQDGRKTPVQVRLREVAAGVLVSVLPTPFDGTRYRIEIINKKTEAPMSASVYRLAEHGSECCIFNHALPANTGQISQLLTSALRAVDKNCALQIDYAAVQPVAPVRIKKKRTP